MAPGEIEEKRTDAGPAPPQSFAGRLESLKVVFQPLQASKSSES
jgi:hypothetical protein